MATEVRQRKGGETETKETPTKSTTMKEVKTIGGPCKSKGWRTTQEIAQGETLRAGLLMEVPSRKPKLGPSTAYIEMNNSPMTTSRRKAAQTSPPCPPKGRRTRYDQRKPERLRRALSRYGR